MAYSRAWFEGGRKNGRTKYFRAWKVWYKKKYYPLRFWFYLTGYVPERKYFPGQKTSTDI
jgi:hypothetical protein